MRQSGQTMHPAWSEIEDDVTWATVGAAGAGAVRLMVEHLPDGLWMWTTWRSSRPNEIRCGSLLTREAACAAAEGAARQMAMPRAMLRNALDGSAGDGILGWAPSP